MIGWKCQVGKITTWPTNLDTYNWLDKNANFTISTCFSVDEKDRLWRSQTGSNMEESINLLENEMGNDFSTIYCFPIQGMQPPSIPNFSTVIPSVYKNIPNTIALAETRPYTESFTLGVYIKSLSRFIYVGSDGRVYVYRVANSKPAGVIYVLNNWPGINTMYKIRSSTNSIVLSPLTLFSYKSKEDFLNKDKWGTFYITIFDDNLSFSIDSQNSQDNMNAVYWSFIQALFGEDNNVDPDFDLPSGPPDNPYDPGGDSGEGGGGGTFDDSSDQIVDSSLPTLSSANTGFTRIYNPTLAQVQDLAQYLWTDESVIQTIWNHIKQFFENPMEAIIGFNLVPVPVPNGGTKNFALMYIDTGVQMTVAANQFVDQDCGTLEIPLYYGSALDYSPYTKISCFLPFIGMVQLNTDEVMGRTLQVKYRVDICSGSCVAKIFVDGNCLYQYSGHCAINIPISAADFSSYVTASISVAKLAVGAAAAGASGLVAASTVDPTQQTNQVITRTTETTTARNPSTGRQITTGTKSIVETVERPTDVSSTQASFDGLSPSNISNTVGQIMTSKPHVEHSGSFSGNTGYLGIRRPYVVIERPNMCMPAQYQSFNGFPSMITILLGTCHGFTRIQQVQLTGMEATNPEQSEILQMLKSGVIL